MHSRSLLAILWSSVCLGALAAVNVVSAAAPWNALEFFAKDGSHRYGSTNVWSDRSDNGGPLYNPGAWTTGDTITIRLVAWDDDGDAKSVRLIASGPSGLIDDETRSVATPTSPLWTGYNLGNDIGITFSQGGGRYFFRLIATDALGNTDDDTWYVDVGPLTNGVTWNSIGLPTGVNAGQTISFTATVTNSGTKPWGPNHYLELKDWNGTHLYYPSIANVLHGGSITVTFNLTVPSSPGTYTYYFTAVEYGVEYFGGSQAMSTRVYGSVWLSASSRSTSSMPRIYTNEPMPTYYRLRAKFSGNYHAATALNNNGQLLDSLPAPGSYTVDLYWIKYDNAMNATEVGPMTNVPFTVNSPTDTTPPSVPAGLGAANIVTNSFTLSWSASTDNVGVTAYEVQCGSTSLGTTGSLSMAITGLSASTTYQMTVRARDAAGNWSTWSAALGVTTAQPADNQLNVHLPVTP